ncbi:hypothetical protein BY996DRAFT_6488171 [Phakopsora pachyrhizi]|nr:hypothetical protein BY996DRAFT_6488171 [Phakopsora pachyrhizi]
MNRVRQWMDGWMDGEEGREVVQDGGDHQTKVVVVVVVVVRMMMIAVGIREFDEIDGYMKPSLSARVIIKMLRMDSLVVKGSLYLVE